MMEHKSMDSFGYPVRVVEPPIYPDRDRDENRQKCQWTIYKDPTQVPVEIYYRCGRVKPKHFGSNNSINPDAENSTHKFLGNG